MKQLWKRLLSICLSAAILLSLSAPMSAYAKTTNTITLTVEENYADYVYLSWKNTTKFKDGVLIQKSTDKKKWYNITRYYSQNGSYSVEMPAKKLMYYRVTPFNDKGYDWDKGKTIYEYGTPSNIVRACSKLRNFSTYTVCDNQYSTVSWTLDRYYKKYVSGFEIYRSVNGGKMKLMASKSVNKPYEKDDWSLSYRYKNKAPSKYGYVVKYLVKPYFVYKDKRYYLNKTSGKSTDVYSSYDFASVVTKSDTVTVKMKKLGGNPTYKISYTYYNIRKGKTSKTKTVKTTKTSYTIKNAACKNYTYSITVTPVWGKLSGSTVYLYSHEPYQIMNRTKAVSNKSIPVINTRGKSSYTDWTYSLTKSDYKIIDDFFYKAYKGKNPSRAEMAHYALEWINQNVAYAYDYSKVDGLSYCDAIFNKKMGQCLQYNGAFAEVLAYLGYESRVIEGYRADSNGKPTISHYWCEVKVMGRWYLCETGNYGKNGYWMYFCSLYANSRGYTKNGVDAYDE